MNDVHDARSELPPIGATGRVLIPLGLAGAIAIAAAGVAIFGVLPRRAALAALEQAAAAPAARRVTFAKAAAGSRSQSVTLPARLEAQREVAVFARESGYIERLHAEVGDRVTQGATLATLQTPVLDSRLAAAEAAVSVAAAHLAEAQARLALSRTSLTRLQTVNDPRAVTAQAIDEAKGRVDVDAAAVQFALAAQTSARAERDGVAAQKSQAVLVASCDGEVSQRQFDPGALVVADKSDSAKPIFRIVDRSSIRVFVQLPQSIATQAAVGQEVRVSVRELAGREFKGAVTRLAPVLEADTRARLLEARLDNADGTLMPGMFAAATITVSRTAAPVLVPGEAVSVQEGKMRVVVIDAQDRVRHRDVIIARDTGTSVEIREGVAADERVAVNLTEEIPEGELVEPVDRSAK
jgi:RND family efflux transporter MFP subunit